MIALATTTQTDCWNHIGVRGDRSCAELPAVVHCQNCPVFAAAGRRFLDAPSPAGYLEEWTDRLAASVDETASDLESVLIIRLADEWLALSVHVLIEVAHPKPIRRIPHRSGVLAGLVNIRGELNLCAHLTKVLGIEARPAAAEAKPIARMLLVRRDAERWVLPVDEVDHVHRIARTDVGQPPATVTRAAAHLCRGVFHHDDRAVGLLDEARLFEALRIKLR